MIAEAEFAAANCFLAPVFQRGHVVKARAQSILEYLSSVKIGGDDPTNIRREDVIRKALLLLRDIHLCLRNCLDPILVKEVLYNSAYRRTIDALLDLISLEGIYPLLQHGVGVPIERRVKSVFQGGFTTRAADADQTSNTDQTLLLNITDQLKLIATDSGRGVSGVLRERTLVDLIAALGQLAFLPSPAETSSRVEEFNSTLEHIPASTLFSILTSLLHPATPAWLRPSLSASLSLLPLRMDGVRDSITFIANTVSQTQNDTHTLGSSLESALSLESLNHASKLLSSVPSSLTTEQFFVAIAPQLLTLLDDTDPGMQQAAAYIIGNGILSRRVYGAPGRIGWTLFVRPLAESLNPISSMPDRNGAQSNIAERVFVSSNELLQALQRLEALTSVHPNPGLVKRLISPLMLPLWRMLCLASEIREQSNWYTKAFLLLSTYLKLSAGAEGLMSLADNLLWEDERVQACLTEDGQNIELRVRPSAACADTDFTELMHNIDVRVEMLLSLLSKVAGNEDISTLFVHVTRNWLLAERSNQPRQQLEFVDGSRENPFSSLASAKIVQTILQNYRDAIASQPDGVFGLLQQLLESYVDNALRANSKPSIESSLSLGDLGAIVQNGTAGDLQPSEDSADLVSLSLSILSTLLTPDFEPRSATRPLLESIRKTTDLLSASSSASSSIHLSAINISMLISNIMLPSKDVPAAAKVPSSDCITSDRSAHTLALQYLSSALPPVRAEGLSILTSLIDKSSPVLDIPTLTILLISVLQDEEEYIYLLTIKGLGFLAQRHSRTVVRMLVERYMDRDEESGLDVRLRIGESLRATVDLLGETLVGDTARCMGEGMITVASRRTNRPKQLARREKDVLAEKLRKHEAEEALGGEAPQLGSGVDEVDDASVRIANVLVGWEGTAGDEDIRIRTSALSILGTAIEINVSGIGVTTISNGVDLAISILKIERKRERAILRRAAALLFMSVLRGLDRAYDEGRDLGFGLVSQALSDVTEVLEWAREMDQDELVRGHLGEVLAGLEMWREKSLLGLRRGGRPSADVRLGSEGNLRGLDFNLTVDKKKRPRIEEVE